MKEFRGKPICPACDSMSIDSLKESSVGFGDSFPLEIETYACIDCGLVYLDYEYTEEVREELIKLGQVPE